MNGDLTYTYQDVNEREQTIEVHYDYVKGCKGVLNRLPEDCHPAEGPEISILYIVDKNGNEMTEKEMQPILEAEEENIINAIIEEMEAQYS